MKDRWEIKKDAAKQWRWKRFAANNREVGSSSEAYHNLQDCMENAMRNGMTGEAGEATGEVQIIN